MSLIGKIKNKLILTMCIALIVCSFTGCGDKKQEDNTEDSQTMVMQYGDNIVTVGEVYIYIRTVQERYELQYGEDVWQLSLPASETDSVSMADLTREAVVEEIVKVKTLVAHASDYGISLTDAEDSELHDKAKEFYDGLTDEDISSMELTEDKIYQVNALSEVYVKNDLVYLRLNRLDKTFDHMFLYDGKDLYFFIDNVTIVTLDREINLSPMSYVNCSYLNMIEYYDKESDTYGSIDYDKGSVYVKNDYMNIDVSLDRVVYKDDFYLLGGDFGSYKKITDIDKK